MDKDIYIIRHGQTEYNKSGIVQGSGVDSSLNDIGRTQAQQFYDHYNGVVSFDLIIHSALKRSRQTIGPWLMNNRIEVREDARINEISWGDHEGRKSTEQDKLLYISIMEEWANGNYNIAITNGETAAELHDRMVSFVNHLKELKYQSILICSHGRAMKSLICALREEPPSQMMKYNISNVGLFKCEQKGMKFEITSENDTSHRTPLA